MLQQRGFKPFCCLLFRADIQSQAALHLWHFLEGQEECLLQTAAFLGDGDPDDFTQALALFSFSVWSGMLTSCGALYGLTQDSCS